MRVTFLILAGLCAVALAAPQYKLKKDHKVADKVFLQKQKDVLRLFKYVHQPSYYKDHVETAKSFDFKQHFDFYTKPEVAKQFWHYYEHGMLPRGQIFSVFYYPHLEQAIALYKLFYYAKDYETFYKTAVWARQHVNEGMYVYALSVAIVHRQDTHGIVLPPIYEVYPYYFFNHEVIEKAQHYKQIFAGMQKPQTGDFKGYTLFANYSGWYMNVHPEQSMSYFTEDVGINSYYYYFNIYYPFWLSKEDTYYHNERHGEQYYYVYQQLLARYYLERLSNDFGEIEHFDYDHEISTGYYPTLQYQNGLEFPTRPSNAYLYKYFYNGEQSFHNYNHSYAYEFVKDYERRIRDAIDSGFVGTLDGSFINIYKPEGFEMLGNLIEGNPNSPHAHFYGAIQIFARYLLGYSNYPLHHYKVAPSALEHFETSLRDPMFFQFYKRIIGLFQKYKVQLPHYTHNDLFFDGVKVQDVHVEKLMTYFDMYDSDITHSVYVHEAEYETEPFQIHARQYRLNHKPFTYKITVNSEKPVEAFVRVFLGPKYDEYGREFDINDNRMNFVEIDKFHYSLKQGTNDIVRDPEENHYIHDRTTYKQLYKYVLNALEGKEEFILDGQESFYGFPYRYLLPKGKVGGMTYQFYVMVSPFHPYKSEHKYQYPVATGCHHYYDTYALGYPFDRYIHDHEFYVPNSYFKDVVIYHKPLEKAETYHH